MKTKKFWKWTNEALNEPNETRNLELYGTIAESSWFDDEITPQMFKDELFHGKGPVTIWINSPGGDCIAASQIYTMLMEYPGEVTIKIDGLAASAASVIAMAGSKVLMAPTAMMMIHNPMTNAFGDHVEMQKAIEMLEEVKESIINAYEIKTSLSRAKLSRLMDEETWMNAYKAIELGFADALLEDKKTANMKDSYVFSQRKVDAALLNKMTAKTKHKANQFTGRNVDELKNQLKVMEKLFNLGGK